jgi:hypothetical protein
MELDEQLMSLSSMTSPLEMFEITSGNIDNYKLKFALASEKTASIKFFDFEIEITQDVADLAKN